MEVAHTHQQAHHWDMATWTNQGDPLDCRDGVWILLGGHSMKEHHFVVVGVEDSDGSVHFDVDSEVLTYLPDGYIWDTETEEWSVASDDEEVERDDRISAALHEKLYGPIIR
jgi:hypothetical protein